MDIHLKNLAKEVSNQDLITLFSEFGAVSDVQLLHDEEGSANLSMEDKRKVGDAVANLDQTYFMGNIILVTDTRPRRPSFRDKRGGGQRPSFPRRNPDDNGGYRPRFRRED